MKAQKLGERLMEAVKSDSYVSSPELEGHGLNLE